MYTEPVIVAGENMNSRSYVKVYIDGKRYRFYNGKILGIACNPNHASNIKDRSKALATLFYTLKKKLEIGWHPEQHAEVLTKYREKPLQAGELISSQVQELMVQDLSALYKRDLLSVGNAFVDYLKEQRLFSAPIE